MSPKPVHIYGTIGPVGGSEWADGVCFSGVVCQCFEGDVVGGGWWWGGEDEDEDGNEDDGGAGVEGEFGVGWCLRAPFQ